MDEFYDYIIYGAGPTGLNLAYLLSKNNFKVLLLEKENKIGGCWKTEWIENKYFSEHSPRVILKDENSSFFKLLRQINFNYHQRTVPTYGNLFQTNFKIFSFFYKYLSFSDKLKFFSSIIFGVKENQTVLEWMEENKISESGKKALEIFSLTLANAPDKLLMNEIIGTSNFPLMFLEFKDNQEWLNLIEKELLKNKVKIEINTKLIKLYHNDKTNEITKADVSYNGKLISVSGRNHLITFPPLAFEEFLKYQDEIIKNNWLNFKDFEEWIKVSHYISFGFQFHFYSKPSREIFNEWCQSCWNKYNLIVLPSSDYLDKYSYDKQVVEVWSLTIVDTRMIDHELNKDKIMFDILKLLKVKPNKITFSDGLINKKKQWISKDSSFSLGKMGVIKPQGKIKNLFTVGPHNKKGITVINKAVETAVDFIKSQNLKTMNLEKSNYNFVYIILILILIYFIWKFN
jgi:hypothetical protein